jgi:ParB family chromosome partitioning protein
VETGRRLQIIEIDDLCPNPNQPRRMGVEEGLEGLARSIRESGMMQPIVVRRGVGKGARKGGGDGAAWEIVAGERRWRAARLAGLTRVPAVTVEISDRESAEWAVVENLQREDLNPMDRAWAFQKLADRFGATHGEIAEKLGVDRSTVANLVRLTTLEEPVQAMVALGQLGVGHAKAILSLPAGRERAHVARKAARGEWSVRKLEAYCQSIVGNAEPGAVAAGSLTDEEESAQSRRVAARADLEQRLSEHLGTPVEVRTDRSGKKGRLIVRFFDLEQLDGVFDRMGFGGE